MGDLSTKAVLFFYAITGCDTVSFFAGIGKKTVFNIWMVFPHLSHVFSRLGDQPNKITDDDLWEVKHFVVLM